MNSSFCVYFLKLFKKGWGYISLVGCTMPWVLFPSTVKKKKKKKKSYTGRGVVAHACNPS
jgi:hypothetical protein